MYVPRIVPRPKWLGNYNELSEELNDPNKYFFEAIRPCGCKDAVLVLCQSFGFLLGKQTSVGFALVSGGQGGKLAFADFFFLLKWWQTTQMCKPLSLVDQGCPTPPRAGWIWASPCLCWLSALRTTQQTLSFRSHFSPVVTDSWHVRNHVSLLSGSVESYN